jgi:hypothetical protein
MGLSRRGGIAKSEGNPESFLHFGRKDKKTKKEKKVRYSKRLGKDGSLLENTGKKEGF